jgi:hypothetical protein
MILEDVRLKDMEQGDDRLPYYYRTRFVNISTDKGTFSTPARVITRHEYMARSGVPLSRSLPLQLAIDFRELSDAQVYGLMNKSDIAEQILRVTKQFNDITRKAILKISVFQPPYSSLNKMSNEEKIRYADTQADFLQRRLGSGIITFPYLNMSFSEYKEFIDTRYRRSIEHSTIFTLDMKMEPLHLEKILNHLTEKEQPMIIVLIYENWEKTIPQHRIISQHFDNEKVALRMCQVEREEHESHTSELHSVALGGGLDLVSLKQSRGFSKLQRLSLGKIKLFDPRTLSINNIDSTLNDSTRILLDEFEFYQDNFNDFNYVSNIIRGYRGAAIHHKKFQILYYLARTHEAIASTRIFDGTRQLIGKNELPEYIEQTNLRSVPMIRNRQHV